MSDFHFHNREEYKEAVVDAIESITKEKVAEAISRLEGNSQELAYGFKTRISAEVLAGALLGIHGCTTTKPLEQLIQLGGSKLLFSTDSSNAEDLTKMRNK
jgi:hypothetical protein